MPGHHEADRAVVLEARAHRTTMQQAMGVQDSIDAPLNRPQGGRSALREVREPVRPRPDLEPDEGYQPLPSDETFTECLRRLMRASGIGVRQLSHRSWLDISSVSKLVNLPVDPLNPRIADRSRYKQPSRDSLFRLGLAMQLPIQEMDALLLSAGYAPLVR